MKPHLVNTKLAKKLMDKKMYKKMLKKRKSDAKSFSLGVNGALVIFMLFIAAFLYWRYRNKIAKKSGKTLKKNISQ